MKHQEVSEETREKAALYALGSLSQLEARAFEAHLREGCDVCAAELSEFQGVVGALDSGFAEEAPPPYLRDLLAVRISREPQEPFQKEIPRREISHRPDRTDDARREVAPALPAPSRRGAILPWAVAAAFAVAALSLFVSWKQTRQEADSARQQLASVSGEAQELRARLNEPPTDPRVIRLDGQPPAPDSSGQIYWDKANNNWVVAVNLPRPPQGKVYQLWFVKPDVKINAGLIKLDEKGYGFSVINVPPEIGSLDAAAITLEPEGGSAAPTLPIYAFGKAG